MRLYLAGLFTNGFGNDRNKMVRKLLENENKQRKEVPWHLESYHYVHSQKSVDIMRDSGKKIFLDSGAFSAFTLGKETDIKAYCKYIQANEDIIECASVLDGIGDPQKTLDNQITMEQLGTRPLPCFHYGEDPKFLKHYVKNYDYITIGGMVPISTPQLRYWLDEIWEKYLTDGAGRPLLKVHGFGLTTIPLMEEYPWFSVDSSSWVQISSNGNILLCDRFKSLSVSDKSPARKQAGQHYDSLDKYSQKAIRKILKKDGYKIGRLRTEYLSRWAYCCHSFNQLGIRINQQKGQDPKFIRHQGGLF